MSFDSYTLFGQGYDIYDRKNIINISIPDDYRKRHCWLFGTTGVGKTRIIENIAEQDIKKGYSLLILDPKGDVDLLYKIVQLAIESGRTDDLMFFNPIFPEYSMQFNPLKHYYMIEELVSHVTSGISADGQVFFLNVAYETALVIIQSLHMIHGNKYIYKLSDVLNYVSYSKIQELTNIIENFQTVEAAQLAENLNKILKSGFDYYGKVSSSLRVALMELCSGNMGNIIGRATNNKFFDRLESGKSVIMVAQLGALLSRKAAYTAGKVILSSIQAFAGRLYAQGKTLTTPLIVISDEAQSTVYPGFDEIPAKAGSAGIYFMGLCQSISQLYAAIDKHYAHSILDNCNTKLYMKVLEKDTAHYISEHFGPVKKLSPIMQIGGGASFREVEENAVTADDIMSLQPREFYMMSQNGRFFGKTATTSPCNLKLNYNLKKVKEK